MPTTVVPQRPAVSLWQMPVRHTRRPAPVLLAPLLGLALLAGACGGSSGSGDAKSTASGDGAGKSSGDVDKTVQTLLENASGQRGAKVDGPGKVRFVNLLVQDGKAVDVDVFWGRPDEKDKAATVRFGAASDYITPRLAKGFDSAVYSVTVAGTSQELWSWDRFSPKEKDQRTVVWFAGDDGKFNETDIDEPADQISSYNNKPVFPAASAGKTRLYWRELGRAIDSGSDLLVVKSGATCLTNGSGIAGPDTNQLNDEQTFEVAPGAALQLFEGCDGAAVGDAVKAPSSGRAILFAYLGDDDKPHLTVVAVKG